MSELINPDSANIHLATNEEIDLLPAIETAADAAFTNIGFNGLPAAATTEELREAKAIIVSGSPPVGFARLNELGSNVHLEQLSVLPEQAGRGIGGELLEAACKWAAQQGYPGITLSTYLNVKWNAPFYARHGFEIMHDLTPELEALRQNEIALGLDTLGERVVMHRIIKQSP